MYKIKLSPYAKIFYTEWLLDPTSFRYNVAYVQILHGKLDVLRLSTALKKYVNDHLLLNSHIQEIDGEPHWIKNASINELEYVDQPISESELLAYVTNKFDLYSGPLYRFKLIRAKEDVYRFIVVLHHLVVDGSSSDAGVVEAISGYYNNKDYTIAHSIEDQIKLVANLGEILSAKLTQNKAENEKFWRQQLSNIKKVTLSFLKLDEPNNPEYPIEPYYFIEEIRFNYRNDNLNKLNQIKHIYSITPYIYSQCILAMLLYKYTGQAELAINYPIAITEGIDFIYGAQLNINLVPYKFYNGITVTNLLDQSKNFFRLTKQKDIKHRYYPISELFSLLKTDGSISNGILNVSFVQTSFKDEIFTFNGIIKTEALSIFNLDAVTKEALLLEQEIKLRNGKLNYRFRYDNRSFNRALVNNFVTNYKRLFLEILEDLLAGNGGKQISSYGLLDAKQSRHLRIRLPLF